LLNGGWPRGHGKGLLAGDGGDEGVSGEGHKIGEKGSKAVDREAVVGSAGGLHSNGSGRMQSKSIRLHGYVFEAIKQIWAPYQSLDGAERGKLRLEIDKRVARSRGLSIECLQGDMLDLSSLDGRKFDLIYQAVSACYIPEVLPLYRALGHLLPEGGSYWVEHWNPKQIQLEDLGVWSGNGYKIVSPQLSGVQHEWIGYSDEGEAPICWHFIHPLSQLIGGLADVNAEPGSHAHLAAYVPPFFAMLARRRSLC
jgi:hypothetical protein